MYVHIFENILRKFKAYPANRFGDISVFVRTVFKVSEENFSERAGPIGSHYFHTIYTLIEGVRVLIIIWILGKPAFRQKSKILIRPSIIACIYL